MVERHQIEAFLALAEELHFGRAAQRLEVTTSRVSQTIRQLERTVGVPLFRRTSRRVQLTSVGRQLDLDLRPAWQQVEAGIQRAIDTGRGLTGILRVGFVGPAAGQLVTRAAEAFRSRAPDCAVELSEAPSIDVLGWLRADGADLALTLTPIAPGLATGPVLVREAIVVACPIGHPYAGRAVLTAADLARADVLHLAGMPDLAGTDGGVRTVATLMEALTLAGAGRGLLPVGAHVRRYHPRPDLTYVPLAGAAMLEWRLVWLPDRAMARVRTFSDAASESVGE